MGDLSRPLTLAAAVIQWTCKLQHMTTFGASSAQRGKACCSPSARSRRLQGWNLTFSPRWNAMGQRRSPTCRRYPIGPGRLGVRSCYGLFFWLPRMPHPQRMTAMTTPASSTCQRWSARHRSHPALSDEGHEQHRYHPQHSPASAPVGIAHGLVCSQHRGRWPKQHHVGMADVCTPWKHC